METTSDRPRSPRPASGGVEKKPLELVRIVVSDLHLSAGLTIRMPESRGLITRIDVLRRGGKWRSRLVPVPNPLEDFQSDEAFASFLAFIGEKYVDAQQIEFVFNGDCFDPLAVPKDGKLFEPRVSADCARRMELIFFGHPAVVAAIRKFLRLPNAKISFGPGNHDYFLVVEAVQRVIIRHLAGRDAALAGKILFYDEKHDFEIFDRGVRIRHGNDSEPHNAIDVKATIAAKEAMAMPGAKGRRALLPSLLGNQMAAEIANQLKRHNRYVGRLNEEVETWRHAIRHDWKWSFRAVRIFLAFMFRQLFFALDPRRLVKIVETMLSTTKKQPVDEYAEKLFRKEGVKHVCLGHSHKALRKTEPGRTYTNTGSWAELIRLEWPTIEPKWGRMRPLEVAWRSLRHHLYTAKSPFSKRGTAFAATLSVIGLMIAVLLKDVSARDYALDWLRITFLCVLPFFLLKWFLHFFTLEPAAVDMTKRTFALYEHEEGGELRRADLMEYDPIKDDIKECY